MRVGDENNRVAVWRGFHPQLGGDGAVGAGPVFNHERAAPALRQVLADHARQRIRAAARRKAHQKANGFAGVRLRNRLCKHGRARRRKQNHHDEKQRITGWQFQCSSVPCNPRRFYWLAGTRSNPALKNLA